MQALAVLSVFLFYDLFSLYLVNSSDMSLIVGKRSIQKCIHNLQCQPRSYHSSAKCKDIGIIVKSCSLCCKTICANCSSDSFKLVCCNGNSDTCSADQDSLLTFAVKNCMCNLLCIYRIIYGIQTVTSIIFIFNSFLIQIFLNLLLFIHIHRDHILKLSLIFLLKLISLPLQQTI